MGLLPSQRTSTTSVHRRDDAAATPSRAVFRHAVERFGPSLGLGAPEGGTGVLRFQYRSCGQRECSSGCDVRPITRTTMGEGEPSRGVGSVLISEGSQASLRAGSDGTWGCDSRRGGRGRKNPSRAAYRGPERLSFTSQSRPRPRRPLSLHNGGDVSRSSSVTRSRRRRRGRTCR